MHSAVYWDDYQKPSRQGIILYNKSKFSATCFSHTGLSPGWIEMHNTCAINYQYFMLVVYCKNVVCLDSNKLCSRSRTSEQSFVSVCHVYSVSIDDNLMWICEPNKPSKKPACLTSRLTLQPWSWRWHVPLKCLLTFSRLHSVISQKIELFK
jgi:hypothetical protein